MYHVKGLTGSGRGLLTTKPPKNKKNFKRLNFCKYIKLLLPQTIENPHFSPPRIKSMEFLDQVSFSSNFLFRNLVLYEAIVLKYHAYGSNTYLIVHWTSLPSQPHKPYNHNFKKKIVCGT